MNLSSLCYNIMDKYPHFPHFDLYCFILCCYVYIIVPTEENHWVVGDPSHAMEEQIVYFTCDGSLVWLYSACIKIAVSLTSNLLPSNAYNSQHSCFLLKFVSSLQPGDSITCTEMLLGKWVKHSQCSHRNQPPLMIHHDLPKMYNVMLPQSLWNYCK